MTVDILKRRNLDHPALVSPSHSSSSISNISPVRSSSPSNSSMIQTNKSPTILICIALLVISLFIYGNMGSDSLQKSSIYMENSQDIHPNTLNSETADDGKDRLTKTTTDETTFETSASSPAKISLPFLHCGHIFYDDESFSSKGGGDIELVLLHGAAFTKDNWDDSGILKSLCTSGNNGSNRRISVTALDLSVRSTGVELYNAVQALHNHAKILSGNPVAIVSPSASGKAMVELARYYHDEDDGYEDFLKKTVSAWITVASAAVLSTKESVLKSYADAMIPVLAIHGDQDNMGRKVTKKLVEEIGSEGVELNGQHPCYLDSPDDFVRTVLDFLRRKK